MNTIAYLSTVETRSGAATVYSSYVPSCSFADTVPP